MTVVEKGEGSFWYDVVISWFSPEEQPEYDIIL